MLLNQRQLATLNSQRFRIPSSQQVNSGYHIPNRFSQTQTMFSQNTNQMKNNQLLNNPQMYQLTTVLIKYFGRDYAQIISNYGSLQAVISRSSFDIDGFVAQFYAKSGILDPDILKVMQNIAGNQNVKYKQMQLMRLFLINKFLINNQIAQIIYNQSNNKKFNAEQLPIDKQSVLQAKIDILMNQGTYPILERNGLIEDKTVQMQLEKNFAQIKSKYLERTNQQTQIQTRSYQTQQEQQARQQTSQFITTQSQTQTLEEKLQQLLNNDIVTLIAEVQQKQRQKQILNKTNIYIQKVQSFKLDSQIKTDNKLPELDISSIKPVVSKTSTVSITSSSHPILSTKQQNTTQRTESVTTDDNIDNIMFTQRRQETNTLQQAIKPQITHINQNTLMTKSKPNSKTEYVDLSSEEFKVPSLSTKTASSSIDYSIIEKNKHIIPFKQINKKQQYIQNQIIQVNDIQKLNNTYSQYLSFYHQTLKNTQYIPLSFKMYKSIYTFEELQQIMHNQSIYGENEQLYQQENIQYLMETLQIHLSKQKAPINKIQNSVQKGLSLGRAMTIFINTLLQQKINYKLSQFKDECERNPYTVGKTIYQDKIRNVNWLYNMQDNIIQNSIQTFIIITQLMDLVTKDMIELSQLLQSSKAPYHLVQVVKVVQTETIGIAQFHIVLQENKKEYVISTGVRGFKVNYIVTSDKILNNNPYLQFYYNETVIYLKFDLEKLDIITELKKVVGINDYVITLQPLQPKAPYTQENVSVHDLYKTKSYDGILPLQLVQLQGNTYLQQIEYYWPFYRFQLRQLQYLYEITYSSQIKTQRYILIYSVYKAICDTLYQNKEPLTLEQIITFENVPEDDRNIIYSILCFYFK